MPVKISDNYDVIVVGCGIAGSLIGALLSNKKGKWGQVLKYHFSAAAFPCSAA